VYSLTSGHATPAHATLRDDMRGVTASLSTVARGRDGAHAAVAATTTTTTATTSTDAGPDVASAAHAAIAVPDAASDRGSESPVHSSPHHDEGASMHDEIDDDWGPALDSPSITTTAHAHVNSGGSSRRTRVSKFVTHHFARSPLCSEHVGIASGVLLRRSRHQISPRQHTMSGSSTSSPRTCSQMRHVVAGASIFPRLSLSSAALRKEEGLVRQWTRACGRH
jgi:hypothetical protein